MSGLQVGMDTRSNEIHWPYNNAEVENRNCLYVGPSGMGKTYGMERNILEVYQQGLSTLVIDYSGSFAVDKLEPEFKNCLQKDLLRKSIYHEGIGINPFARHLFDPSVGSGYEKSSDTADRIVDILSRIYKFGNAQKAVAYQCIRRGIDGSFNGWNIYNNHYRELTFTDDGVRMNFNLLQYLLEEEDNPAALGVSSKLSSMIDKNIFTNDTFSWNSIIYGEANVTIIDLNGFSNDVQNLITEFLLWDLWYFTRAFGDKSKPFIAVFDECQNLNHRKSSPIAKILTEGRKFGWSAWLATQFLNDQFENDELNRLLQASLKFYFKPVPQDIKLISRALCGDPSLYSSLLNELTKGKCLAHGTLQTANGVTHTNTAIVLKIPAIGIKPIHM